MRLLADRLQLSPSDVTAFLACEHLTTLSLAHARGELGRPETVNEQADLIFRKGLEHERAYLEHLRADGNSVLEIPTRRRLRHRRPRDGGRDPQERCRRLLPGRPRPRAWRCVADFLLRQADGTYEALDTKLARSAKPAYILQLLFYNEELGRIQGRPSRSRSTSCLGTASSVVSARVVRRLLPARPLAARTSSKAATRSYSARPALGDSPANRLGA